MRSLFFIIISFSTYVYGQKTIISNIHPVLRKSESFASYKRNNHHAFKSAYFKENTELIIIKQELSKVIIEKINTNTLQILSHKEYNDFAQNVAPEKILKLGKKYYLFYYESDSKNKNCKINYREIDFSTGNFLDTGSLLIDVDKKDLFYLNQSKCSYQISSDSSKLFVRYSHNVDRYKPEKSIITESFSVFDSNLKLIWSKDIKMLYPDNSMKNSSYLLDDNGTVFFISEILPLGESKRITNSYKPNYNYFLFSVNSTKDIGLEGKPIELNVEGIINTPTLVQDNIGDVYIAGYYGFKSFVIANGIIIYKVSKDGEILTKNSVQFPKELIAKNRYNNLNDCGEIANSFCGINNLIIKDFLRLEDNSYLIVGEEFKPPVFMPDGLVVAPYYKEIILTKIKIDGGIEWINKIAKNQSGTIATIEKEYSPLSYKLISNKDELYIFYMDNKENSKISDNEIPKSNDLNTLVCDVVNINDGSINKIFITDSNIVEGVEIEAFNPLRILEVSKNNFVLECQLKKDKKSKGNNENILVNITF